MLLGDNPRTLRLDNLPKTSQITLQLIINFILLWALGSMEGKCLLKGHFPFHFFPSLMVSRLLLVAVLLVVVRGALDGCSLYAGGDLLYASGNGKLTSGLLRYNPVTQEFDGPGSVYKDAKINGFFSHDR